MGNNPKIDVTRMKERLLERQAELLGMTGKSDDISGPVELDQTRQGRLSRMDALQMQAMAKATEHRRAQELKRIESALRRIETGDYGYCVMTGEEIEIKRLEADPSVPTCLAAAESSER